MKSFSNLEIEGEPLEILDDFELKTQIRLSRSVVRNDWKEVVKICQENWEALNFPITKSQDTVLHLATHNKLEDNFKLLLQELPSEPENRTKVLLVKNTEGNNPLHIAASVGSVMMCRSFIDRSTDLERSLSARNNEGETPLFKAVLHGIKEAFLYFHSICGPKEGHNYYTRKDGETILHRAISEEYFELSFIILRMYSDLVYLADKDGKTPLHVLASKPSAFKSGSDLSWFEKIIYHGKYTVKFSRLVVYIRSLILSFFSFASC
ncbi:isoform 4 of serine/threonine-protein phosphatase 6 regulatory ankyrin repeat subunit a [Fagus crenata]